MRLSPYVFHIFKIRKNQLYLVTLLNEPIWNFVMIKFVRLLTAVLFVSAAPVMAEKGPRILAMGDSFLATNSADKRAVSDFVAQILKEPVKNRAVSGARVIYRLPISGSIGFKIEQQYRKGSWDWIVLNGGGNDLWLGCGCRRCDKKMNKLISKDGARGEIPKLVAKLRKSNARVVYVGYLRSPGAWSPIEGCRDDGEELDARIAKLAKRDKGVWFVSLADLVPHGDRSFHASDMIHPSAKGSAAAAQRIARVIAKHR
jgi:acyl-CoA thioesterase-1